jgi:hypothetical protein
MKAAVTITVPSKFSNGINFWPDVTKNYSF